MAAAPPILQWMSTLSDPVRLRALRVLDRQELSVAELCDVLQLPQSTVSRHLKALSDDSWLAARRDGTSRIYQMAADLPAPARRLWHLLRDQLVESGLSASDEARLERVRAARQTRSQAFFSSSAAYWDRLRTELFGDQVEVPLLSALLDPAWTVGDLGCGTGRLVEALAPFVAQVVAVDASAAMLGAARRRLAGSPNVELRRGDLGALPLGDASLDAAVLALVLHHVGDPGRALAEVFRVLKPGGRAVVLDMQPHDRAEYRSQMGHEWLGFESGRLTAWCEEAGLEQVRVHPLPPTVGVKGPPLFVALCRKAASSAKDSLPGRPGRATTSPPRRRKEVPDDR